MPLPSKDRAEGPLTQPGNVVSTTATPLPCYGHAAAKQSQLEQPYSSATVGPQSDSSLRPDTSDSLCPNETQVYEQAGREILSQIRLIVASHK